eukprot:scaffold76040_cov17-Prasinocladus_malaysianus.AAC.1
MHVARLPVVECCPSLNIPADSHRPQPQTKSASAFLRKSADAHHLPVDVHSHILALSVCLAYKLWAQFSPRISLPIARFGAAGCSSRSFDNDLIARRPTYVLWSADQRALSTYRVCQCVEDSVEACRPFPSRLVISGRAVPAHMGEPIQWHIF